jgi:hypothetical protein
MKKRGDSITTVLWKEVYPGGDRQTFDENKYKNTPLPFTMAVTGMRVENYLGTFSAPSFQ